MAGKVATLFIASLAFVSASILPSVKVLQGPGSQTSLYGPDGSELKSVAPGGTVITDPDAPAGLITAGPAILPGTAEITVGGGPAGKIVTRYTLAGPAVVPAVIPEAAVVPLTATIASPAVAAPTLIGEEPSIQGSIIVDKGQYVPDNAEALFDDGSYREEKY